MDLGFCPDERFGIFVIAFDEGIDVLSELLDGGEGGAAQGLTLENREPDLNLVEPGSAGRSKVEVHIGLMFEPAITFRLEGIEIVKDHMDGRAPVVCDDLVHEIEELDPAPTVFVRSPDLACGCLD